MKKIWFIIPLLIFHLVLFLLISGSPVLLIPIDSSGKIPLGTPITELGMICLSLTIILFIGKKQNEESKLYRFLKTILRFSFIMSICWIPVSYFLAGNFSFSFTEKTEFQGGQEAMRLFWIYSYSTAIIPTFAFAIHLINSFIIQIKKWLG